MARESAAPSDGVRVILCLCFDRKAKFDELTACKQALMGISSVVHGMEVSGSFDFMIEARVADLAAYQTLLDSITARFGTLLERHEANFICRRFDRDEYDRSPCLWVPCEGGRQRIDCGSIDKVTAEGDYVRISCGKTNWLLHATLTSIVNQLSPASFLQLNRSALVRSGFIDRLVHQGRRWIARLVDGTECRIAKARSAAILAALRHDSPMENAGSSSHGRPVEKPFLVVENELQEMVERRIPLPSR